MKRLNLITFASVFQKKEEAAIQMAHKELFEALDSQYDVKIIFDEELNDIPAKGKEKVEKTSSELTVVFIATGGTEGMAVSHYSQLPKPLVLLTDGKANSLAASLELSCWVRQKGHSCQILHGNTDAILDSLKQLETAGEEQVNSKKLSGLRIGVIGHPSDWLVASNVDYAAAKKKWGVQYVDISLELVGELYKEIVPDETMMDEVHDFMENAAGIKEPNEAEIVKAMRLYYALSQIAIEAKLDALTLQCFSLIPTTGTTGCLALALLNDDGIVAGCEGDLQSVFTMLLAKRLTGQDAFMANPSHIDASKNEVLFAHCTIGLKQTQKYIIRSHFESQSGVAIQGILPEDKITVLKFGGKSLDKAFVSNAEILANEDDQRKCRTQIKVHLDRENAAQEYLLNNSIGNHHIIISGHHEESLTPLLKSLGINLV